MFLFVVLHVSSSFFIFNYLCFFSSCFFLHFCSFFFIFVHFSSFWFIFHFSSFSDFSFLGCSYSVHCFTISCNTFLFSRNIFESSRVVPLWSLFSFFLFFLFFSFFLSFFLLLFFFFLKLMSQLSLGSRWTPSARSAKFPQSDVHDESKNRTPNPKRGKREWKVVEPSAPQGARLGVVWGRSPLTF